MYVIETRVKPRIDGRRIKGDAYSPYGSEVVPQTEGEDRFCGEPIKGKRIQIGAYAKSRVYVRISSYSSAYKMEEKDFEQPYYENHMDCMLY